MVLGASLVLTLVAGCPRAARQSPPSYEECSTDSDCPAADEVCLPVRSVSRVTRVCTYYCRDDGTCLGDLCSRVAGATEETPSCAERCAPAVGCTQPGFGCHLAAVGGSGGTSSTYLCFPE